MTGPEALDALVALGGLGGVAATITSLVSVVRIRQVHQDTTEARDTAASAAAQLQPNHGRSVADKTDLILELVRSQGHQIGEIRTDLDAERDDRRALGERLGRLEDRAPMGYPWDK